MSVQSPSEAGLPVQHRIFWIIGLMLSLWSGQFALAQDSDYRFIQEVSETSQGMLVKCDLQHSFSDEFQTVLEFVSQAVENGCQVVFIAPAKPTTHIEYLKQFLKDVNAARLAYPKVVILPVYLWTVHAPGWTDQVMVILPPGDNFERRYLQLPDILIPSTPNHPLSDTADLYLKALCPDDLPLSAWPAVIFNGRSKQAPVHRWGLAKDLPEALWSENLERTASALSFGHVGLLDRWDQSDVYSGGAWDRLLGEGWNAWSAADSLVSFSGSRNFQPGEFSETWLRVPEFTADRVLEAVKTGNFFGVRGHMVRNVELKVIAKGLSRPALAGETIDVPVDTPIRVELTLEIPDLDWQKTPNRLDGIELIAVTPNESRVVSKEAVRTGHVVVTYDTEVPEGGILFRAIGYREVKDSPDYGFFTNPIRVIADGQWTRTAKVVKVRTWIEDYGAYVIIAVTIVLGLTAVTSWLVLTERFTPVLIDIIYPLRKRWKNSTPRLLLKWFMPSWNRSRAVEETTIGTSLTDSECWWLTGVLIGGVTLLGSICGWSTEVPTELSLGIPRVFGGLLFGFACGAAWGGLLRIHAFLGVWLFLMVRVAEDLWPEFIPISWGIASLSATLIAVPIHEALRTGTIRWPADHPVQGLIGMTSIVVLSAVANMAFPGWVGSIAGFLGILVAMVWFAGNLDWLRVPQRTLLILLVAMGWLAVRITTGCRSQDAGAVPCLLSQISEAIGVATLLLASRPERLDALGIVVGQAGLALSAMIIGQNTGEMIPQLALGTAGLGILLCVVAELSWFISLLLAITVVLWGRETLFTHEIPGTWLIGSLICLVVCCVARPRLRLVLFLLPYLAISGYLESFASGLGFVSEQFTLERVFAFFQRELIPFRSLAEAHPLTGVQVTSQLVGILCLAGLAGIYWGIRRPERHDLFDACGRTAGGVLLWNCCLFLYGLPLSGATGTIGLSLIGIWASQLRREDVVAASPLWQDSRFAEPVLVLFRQRLMLVAVVIAGLIAYGSLVPFQWREISVWDAVAEFLEQIQRHISSGTVFTGRLNSDLLVNVSLTIPMAFCLYGSLVLGRRGVVQRFAAAMETWQLSLLFSFLVELAQQWSEGRVASIQDVIAQSLGAGVGVALWLALGEWFLLRLAASVQMRTAEGNWGQLLSLYLLGVLVFAVLPAGLPVTSPRQLFEHVRDGRLCVLPFADAQSWRDVVRDSLAGIVLFFPVGIWGSLAFRRAGQPLRPLISSTMNGVAFAALVTVVRALCSAEMTDSSWLLTGIIGSALGAGVLHLLMNQDADQYSTWRTGLRWWIAALAFGGIIAGFYLHPWMFDAGPDVISRRWQHFVGTPFANFHSGNDWLLIEEIVRKIAWFTGWGMLLGQAAQRSSEFSLGKMMGYILAIVLAAVTGMGIELAQIYQSQHSGDLTDVIIGLVGVGFGLWLRGAGTGSLSMDGELALVRPEEVPPPAAVPMTWSTILQTVFAVGLAVGLLIALVVLLLRR